MNDESRMHFKMYDEAYPAIRRLFETEKKKILAVAPKSIVEHVGSSSVPGALTAGDLDIQVRVLSEDFIPVVQKLRSFFEENHPERWTDALALFRKTAEAEPPISVAVTVINSSYDEFIEFRDFLKLYPAMLRMYNDFKKSFEGKTEEEYKEAKRNLFVANGTKSVYKNLFHRDPPQTNAYRAVSADHFVEYLEYTIGVVVGAVLLSMLIGATLAFFPLLAWR